MKEKMSGYDGAITIFSTGVIEIEIADDYFLNILKRCLGQLVSMSLLQSDLKWKSVSMVFCILRTKKMLLRSL